MPASVILSEAKNLMDSDTYYLEILRLAPQNDVVGQPDDGEILTFYGYYSEYLDSKYIVGEMSIFHHHPPFLGCRKKHMEAKWCVSNTASKS